MAKQKTIVNGSILLAVSILMVATSLLGAAGKPPPPPPPPVAKLVTFGICEDYDKGQDLNGIALDFQLLNELDVDTMRISLGWDDYEPARGVYDFTWLHSFCNLAAQYGIKLRPYICYAAPWATASGYWNEPPVNMQDWHNFIYNLALALHQHTNVISYELWNEENDDTFWFTGSVQQYMEMLRLGAQAIRAADPGKQILLGGLQWADDDWLRPIVEAGYAQYYEITPVHVYDETWDPDAVETWFDSQWTGYFVPHNNTVGEAEPIWVNEIGYATYLENDENDQANYICRAISYFLSDPEIEHICWYEIKDLDPGSVVIGDEKNYYLGLTRWPDRSKKPGFYTYDMITDLLDKKTVTPADAELTVTVVSGRKSRHFYQHLLKLSDGSQVVFVYDKLNSVTVNIRLTTPGSTAYKYNILNNTSAVYAGFANNTLSNLALGPGQVAVFKIIP